MFFGTEEFARVPLLASVCEQFVRKLTSSLKRIYQPVKGYKDSYTQRKNLR